jgi:hypothetical protein
MKSVFHGKVATPLRTRFASRLSLSQRLLTETDERHLLLAIAGVAFADFAMRGVVARRRVAFFGQ